MEKLPAAWRPLYVPLYFFYSCAPQPRKVKRRPKSLGKLMRPRAEERERLMSGKKVGGKESKEAQPSTESVAFAHNLRGVHW